MGRAYGGQWLSSTTRHVRIFAAYIDPETCAFDQTQMDKELVDHYEDIRTGVIIGRGTERQGLYYVDEVTQQGTVMLAHGTDNREAWLWHRRLGHPSHGYSHLCFQNSSLQMGK
ncbi:putative NAD(P)H-quinone oxidoreductase subunit M, GAG-pre-integrase domain-containing protein [Helianthus annuus]|nr:putative NAD(P)H-quinone oxidoreductase subunit M, GAG-pre-integrase domain-containing protein [Helianthus annuus]